MINASGHVRIEARVQVVQDQGLQRLVSVSELVAGVGFPGGVDLLPPLPHLVAVALATCPLQFQFFLDFLRHKADEPVYMLVDAEQVHLFDNDLFEEGLQESKCLLQSGVQRVRQAQLV